MHLYPQRSRALRSEIRRAVGVDSAALQEHVVLGELGLAARCVDRVGFPAALAHHGEHGHVARPVRDVNHVAHGHPPVRVGDFCVHVYLRVFVRALVDFKHEARLDGVVHYHSNLRYLPRKVGQPEFRLARKIRRKGLLNELTAENPVHVRGYGAAAYHLRQPRAYYIVFERHVDAVFARALGNGGAQRAEKFGQPRAEFQARAELAELGVVEPAHSAVAHEAQQVVEIDALRRDPHPALGVEGGQHVHLFPKELFVHAVLLENGGLHVSVDKGLVEVPQAGHHVPTADRIVGVANHCLTSFAKAARIASFYARAAKSERPTLSRALSRTLFWR